VKHYGRFTLLINVEKFQSEFLSRSAMHIAFTVRSLFATDIPCPTAQLSRRVLGPCIQITGLPSRNMSRSRSLNTAVSRVTNRGAKSRSSRRRPSHDIRICQLGGNFLSRDGVILKSSLAQTERGVENRGWGRGGKGIGLG